MKPQQEKPTTFDRFADDYSALLHDPIREKFATTNRFFFERKMQVIRRFFRSAGIESRDLDWLDVGCGQGDMLRVGRPWFKSATGCDPSEGMLRACSDLDVRKQESFEKLPFNDATFDFLTAVCVYHHVPFQQRPPFTCEALRLLKPGGIFCVIEHNPWNPATRIIVSRSPIDADANLLSFSETRRLLSAGGAEVVAAKYFLLFPETMHRYVSAIEDGLEALPLGGQYSVFCRKR
jgi:ubiquinone/menaquinone biosynthesis C-methylase UbiE